MVRNERQGPAGATEEEVAAIAEARKNLSNLAKEETRINKQLAPLMANVRPLQERLAEIQGAREAAQRIIHHTIWQADRRTQDATARAAKEVQNEIESARRAGAARKWGEMVEDVRQQITGSWEVLSTSVDSLSQDVATVLGRVLETPDFVNHLPNAMEESLVTTVTQTNNSDRLRVISGKDSCRLLLLKDGTFGVIYNPKPGSIEMDAAVQIADSVKMPQGTSVNPNIFGIHIEPYDGSAFPFSASRRDSFQGKPFTPQVVNVGLINEAIPLMSKMHEILTNGDIDFPKRLGKVTIPHPSRA